MATPRTVKHEAETALRQLHPAYAIPTDMAHEREIEISCGLSYPVGGSSGEGGESIDVWGDGDRSRAACSGVPVPTDSG